MWSRAMKLFDVVCTVACVLAVWVGISFGFSLIFMLAYDKPAPELALPLGACVLWYKLKNPDKPWF
jgi:hypothetical protein